MSPWLVESGDRTKPPTFHQATEHVTRLVSSAVDAPSARQVSVATGQLSVEVTHY